MPEDEFFKIVTYQLNADVCPHFKFERVALCGIYERRPLACKSFPFRLLENPVEELTPRLVVQGTCSFVQKSEVKEPSKIEDPARRKRPNRWHLK